MPNTTYLNAECEEQLEKAPNDLSKHIEQECRQRELAIARMSGMKVLEAISASVPGKIMAHDLVFLSELLISGLDLRHLKVLIRLHGIKTTRDAATPPKMLANSIQKMEESELMRLLVECAILIAARTETMTAMVLQDAAQYYGVDVRAICEKVRRQVSKNPRIIRSTSAKKREAATRSAAA
jgi:ParB family chromosome partitioning protein